MLILCVCVWGGGVAEGGKSPEAAAAPATAEPAIAAAAAGPAASAAVAESTASETGCQQQPRMHCPRVCHWVQQISGPEFEAHLLCYDCIVFVCPLQEQLCIPAPLGGVQQHAKHGVKVG